jgi:hypothetical protein
MDLYLYALPVGHYTLSVSIASTYERLGFIVAIDFMITSITSITTIEEEMSGIISEQHTLVFFLNDSLMESIDGADVWVSIYDSLDREIYGHPLSSRTLLTSSTFGTTVSWTPTITGEYRIEIVFEGAETYNQTSIECVVLVRYPSSLSLEAPQQSEFGDIVPITITLEGAIGGLSGETILLTVYNDGVVQMEESLTTASRGVISHNIVGLLAGSHVVQITFIGSDTQAPCSANLLLEVTPVLVIALDNEDSLFVGRENTVSISVSILGTNSDWVGSLEAVLLSPTNELLDTWTFEIDSYSVLDVNFSPLVEGTYSLNVTVYGLPVVIERAHPLSIAVIYESLQIELDASNTSLLGGFGILSVIGVVMRKKLKGVVGSMPGEWTG